MHTHTHRHNAYTDSFCTRARSFTRSEPIFACSKCLNNNIIKRNKNRRQEQENANRVFEQRGKSRHQMNNNDRQVIDDRKNDFFLLFSSPHSTLWKFAANKNSAPFER